MSLLYDARWQAFDNSGNPLVGATLTVYNTGGTVLASIWRDAALTIAMTNPTSGTDKSDAAGRFGQVFTAENAVFDVLLKDSLGNTVATYVNVVGLGANSGTFTRDFTNSRVSLRGAGGTVFVEAGDPAGDDVGGTMSLGGWLGTQADLITLNAVLVNVTGRIKENGKKLPSVVYTEATQFTAVTQVDIALPNDPVGCRAYDLEIFDYQQSGVGTLKMVFSYDGGSTYKTGASDYKWSLGVITGGSGLTSAVDTSDPSIQVSSSMAGLAGANGLLKLRIVTPNSGNDMTLADWDSSGIDAGGNYCTTRGFGYGGPTYGRVTNVRLLLTASTMTGKYLVRPGRGYGET